MKTAIVILGLTVVCQTFVATGFAQTKNDKGGRAKVGTVDHATTGAANHPGFEYRVASPDPTETEEQALNKSGKEGWELVAVVGHEDSKRATFYLKRAIR